MSAALATTAKIQRARRPWTKAEVRVVLESYLEVPAREIARRLGRPRHQIYAAAFRYGASHSPQRFRFTAAVGRRLKRLVERRLCNLCIGRELGAERHTIQFWRARLGLAASGGLQRCPRCIERTRETTRRQCAAAGFNSLAALQKDRYRQYVRDSGWPAGLRPRHVQMLDLLYRQGPQTRRQIAMALAMPFKNSRKALHSNDPEGSYLAHLQARGLVVRLGRSVKGRGRGHSVYLYAVPLGVAPRIPSEEKSA